VENLSLFRDLRRRDGIRRGNTFGALLLGLSGFCPPKWRPSTDRILSHEPILGLFINPRGYNDFISYSERAKLIAEERLIRASYPKGQSFSKKNVVLIVVDSLRADHMLV
jgi:hypothetical protein